MRDEDRETSRGSESESSEDPDFDQITGGESAEKTDNDSSESVDALLNQRLPSIQGTIGSQSTESIDEVAQLSSSSEIETIGTRQTPSAGISHNLETLVEPTQRRKSEEDQIYKKRDGVVPVVGGEAAGRTITHRITDSVRLEDTLTEEKHKIGVVNQDVLSTDNQTLANVMTLNTAKSGTRPEEDRERIDPSYLWTGGTPYATTRPQCIIHKSQDDIESLPFLQRILRDTYTELEGGRPKTRSLTARGHSLTDTSVHGSIVTLDLTKENWNINFDSNPVTLSYDDRDLLSKVQGLLNSLYGGKLGYLVVNVDAGDFQSRFHSNREEVFVAALLDEPAEDILIEQDTDSWFTDYEPPIRITEPRDQERASFQRLQAQYFGFHTDPDSSDNLTEIEDYRTAEFEAAQDARIRRNDWRRIALTNRQDEESDGESDEHYLWKATLVEGIARRMYDRFVENQQEVSFDSFVEQELLPNGPIQTEADDVLEEGVPDLWLSTQKPWALEGIQDFLQLGRDQLSSSGSVSIEFETGRSEGAFNFRKIRETLDKYEDNSSNENFDDLGYIAVVVPPRVLFRSESRSRMVKQLVSNWSPNNKQYEADLHVPHLGQYRCKSLVSANKLINEWFQNDNE